MEVQIVGFYLHVENNWGGNKDDKHLWQNFAFRNMFILSNKNDW